MIFESGLIITLFYFFTYTVLKYNFCKKMIILYRTDDFLLLCYIYQKMYKTLFKKKLLKFNHLNYHY